VGEVEGFVLVCVGGGLEAVVCGAGGGGVWFALWFAFISRGGGGGSYFQLLHQPRINEMDRPTVVSTCDEES